jgi:putative oxidoreductase
MIPDMNHAIAIATIRIIAGVLFFFQGFDKVFHVGITQIRQAMRLQLGGKSFPDGLLSLIVIFTSYVELLCGFLLILGLFKYYSIYLLCFSLLLVVTGFSYAKPMWENNHLFVRLILLATLLLTPVDWDRFSLDYLFVMTK